jgi:hypothetical protein
MRVQCGVLDLTIAAHLPEDISMNQLLEECPLRPASPAPAVPGCFAEIAPVSSADRGHVLNSWNLWVAAALTLLPIPVGLIGGFGGLGLGAYLSSRNPALAGVCAALGLVCGVLSVLALVSFQHVLASRFLRSVACRRFALRVDSQVHPDAAHVDFVDVIPRSHWGQLMLEPATDIGFFAIDQSRRELLLEGDSKRYRIPFGAVASCQIEEYALGREQWEADLHFVTVLTVETANGPREIPLAGRHLAFHSRRAAERRAQAQELCGRILLALNG